MNKPFDQLVSYLVFAWSKTMWFKALDWPWTKTHIPSIRGRAILVWRGKLSQPVHRWPTCTKATDGPVACIFQKQQSLLNTSLNELQYIRPPLKRWHSTYRSTANSVIVSHCKIYVLSTSDTRVCVCVCVCVLYNKCCVRLLNNRSANWKNEIYRVYADSNLIFCTFRTATLSIAVCSAHNTDTQLNVKKLDELHLNRERSRSQYWVSLP